MLSPMLNSDSDPDMVDSRCMCFTTKSPNEIIVAGCQSQMYRIDIDSGTIIDKVGYLLNSP